ncbi:DNA-binding protein [Rhizobium sp. AC44/96]|uniref:helix-turn-helix transcriptional regulator n=1 Tax=Rhizobium sp. AC44/96 TaxID=1841654 RepID=UPI00080F78E0|nr:LuxR C-terminal-related transcriptional regulator [Rhizobium sp. AC44/96]OCJ15061.1 DNA-binding protein [Rhizobium sp. AC44/96]
MRKHVRAVRDGVEDTVFPHSDRVPKTPASMIGERLGEMARRTGHSYYLLAAFPRGDRAGFAVNCLATNWPQEIIDFYEDADLFYCCKLVNRLKRSVMPVFCDKAPFESTAANQENPGLVKLFRTHGLKNTFAFTLHDADLRQYIFAFSGDRAKASRDEAMAQVFLAMEFLEMFSQDYPVERPSESLSNREIECLRWSAAGKSSEEIAIILDLSSHTVVGYLKSAMRKLDSVNRMQAVARAFRYRLL